MHVVAVTSSLASTINVLLTLGIEEVSDRREDSADFLAIEKPTIDIVECIFGVLLVTILHIDVSYDVVSQIIDDNHILEFSVLTHLFEYFLKKLFESKIKETDTY